MSAAFLGIETATRQGSVAILRDSALETAWLGAAGGHAAGLLDVIARLFDRTGTPRDRLRGIGVATGPGSFTGVRVGMATAMGLAYALDVPVTGLSTLEAMGRSAARSPEPADCPIAAVLEAGRGEVYAALFDAGGGRMWPDRAWRPEALLAGLPGGARLCGDGAERLNAAAATPRPVVDLPPRAAALARAAAGSEAAGYSPGGLRPNYIRPTDAEASRRPS